MIWKRRKTEDWILLTVKGLKYPAKSSEAYQKAKAELGGRNPIFMNSDMLEDITRYGSAQDIHSVIERGVHIDNIRAGKTRIAELPPGMQTMLCEALKEREEEQTRLTNDISYGLVYAGTAAAFISSLILTEKNQFHLQGSFTVLADRVVSSGVIAAASAFPLAYLSYKIHRWSKGWRTWRRSYRSQDTSKRIWDEQAKIRMMNARTSATYNEWNIFENKMTRIWGAAMAIPWVFGALFENHFQEVIRGVAGIVSALYIVGVVTAVPIKDIKEGFVEAGRRMRGMIRGGPKKHPPGKDLKEDDPADESEAKCFIGDNES